MIESVILYVGYVSVSRHRGFLWPDAGKFWLLACGNLWNRWVYGNGGERGVSRFWQRKDSLGG